jgi:hypothetical protein
MRRRNTIVSLADRLQLTIFFGIHACVTAAHYLHEKKRLDQKQALFVVPSHPSHVA